MNDTGLDSVLTFGAGRGGLDSAEFQCKDIFRGQRAASIRPALAAAFAAAFSLLLAAGAAEAQTEVKLVGNSGQSTDSPSTFANERAQAFTTGSWPDGYRLTRVDVPWEEIPITGTYKIDVYKSNASSRPGDWLGTLGFSTNSGRTFIYRGSGDRFDLEPGTTYFVFLDITSGSNSPKYRLTNSDEEDSGPADGWSMGDGGLWRTRTHSSWTVDK